jgi:hypothetical protein
MTDLTIPGDLLARGKVITGLRQLADCRQAHPGLPVNIYGWDVQVHRSYRSTEAQGRAEVDQIAAILGVPVHDQTANGGHYAARRRFGLITYAAVCVPDRRQAAYEALMSYSGAVTPGDNTAEGVVVS